MLMTKVVLGLKKFGNTKTTSVKVAKFNFFLRCHPDRREGTGVILL